MPKEFPEIYFSYAWGDPNQGKDSIEYFIDELYNSLKADGYPVKRDKMDMSYGDLISDFMREIGEADLIVIGISDKYLRSHYCMWELCEIYRNSALDAKMFIPKLLPIRIEEINFDTQTRRKYIEHWEERYNEINKFINDHPDAINAEDQKDQQKIRRIRNDFTAIIGQIKDINSLTKASLEENDFEKIKKEINSRTGVKPIKGEDFKNGKIVHNIPPKMQIGILIRCKIKIAREIAHFELDKDFKSGNFSEPENLAISELMKVEIKGDSRAFEITSLTENEMYLEVEESTTWLFDIKPLIVGKHKLTLLAYTMKERGKRNSRYYEANIEVVTDGTTKQVERVIDEVKKEPAIGSISSISLPNDRLEQIEENFAGKKVMNIPPLISEQKYKIDELKRTSIFPTQLKPWYKKYQNTIIGSFISIGIALIFIFFGSKLSCNKPDHITDAATYKRIEIKLDLSEELFNIYKDSLSFSFIIDNTLYVSKLINNLYYFDSIPNSFINRQSNILVNLNSKEIQSFGSIIDSSGIKCFIKNDIIKYQINTKNEPVSTIDSVNKEFELTFNVSGNGEPLKNTEINVILNDTSVARLFTNQFGISKFNIKKFKSTDKLRIIAKKQGYKIDNDRLIYNNVYQYNDLKKEIYISFKKSEDNKIDAALITIKINQVVYKVSFVNSERIADLIGYLRINEGEDYMRNHLSCDIYVNGTKMEENRIIRESILPNSHVNLICDSRMATAAMRFNEIKLLNKTGNNNIKVKINDSYTKIKKINATESIIYSFNLLEGNKNSVIVYDFKNNKKYSFDKFINIPAKAKKIELTSDFKLIQR